MLENIADGLNLLISLMLEESADYLNLIIDGLNLLIAEMPVDTKHYLNLFIALMTEDIADKLIHKVPYGLFKSEL